MQFGVKFVSYWLVLAILWLKVAKNYSVSKIRVFLGSIFGVSLAQGNKEIWHFQNSCLSGQDLAFLWLEVAKKHGISEICVFLDTQILFYG